MILNKRPVGPCAAMPVGRALFRMGIGTLAHGRLDSHQGPFVMRQEAGPHQVFARVVHSFALVFVRAVAIPQAGVLHQPVDVLGRILFHVACPAEIVGHESLHAVSSGAYEHQFGQQERVVEQLPAHPFGLLAAVQMVQVQYAQSRRSQQPVAPAVAESSAGGDVWQGALFQPAVLLLVTVCGGCGFGQFLQPRAAGDYVPYFLQGQFLVRDERGRRHVFPLASFTGEMGGRKKIVYVLDS